MKGGCSASKIGEKATKKGTGGGRGGHKTNGMERVKGETKLKSDFEEGGEEIRNCRRQLEKKKRIFGRIRE